MPHKMRMVYEYAYLIVTKREVESLLRIYVELNKGNYGSKFDRAKFRDVLHNTFNMTDDMIMDRGIL